MPNYYLNLKHIVLKSFLKCITHYYLIRRKQCVVLNGCKSNWVHVRIGVLQGSVIGPILFIIYVNDLPSVMNSQCLMSTDEEKATTPNFIDLFTQIVVYFSCKEMLMHYMNDILNKWQLLFSVHF